MGGYLPGIPRCLTYPRPHARDRGAANWQQQTTAVTSTSQHPRSRRRSQQNALGMAPAHRVVMVGNGAGYAAGY
jgi:hypothetical protein